MAGITDGYGRNLNYVRISVTDRCNFRCRYCMPPEGVKCIPHSEIMRYEEIEYLCEIFWKLGVRKFRFTGGEPLVRRGIVQFLQSLKSKLPEMNLALTTNASQLASCADELADAGVNSLNISLDTVDARKFTDITRIGHIEDAIKGITAAKSAGIKNIKINTVLIKGFNDGEVGDLLKFSKEHGLLLRLIEFMPLEDDVWSENRFINGLEVLRSMADGDAWRPDTSAHKKDDGPAQYYVNDRNGGRIGIITAVSSHFCSECNRLRVSASGNLRTCLFNPKETPMRELILKHDEKGLKELILSCVKDKPRCWNDVRTGRQHMSGIGG